MLGVIDADKAEKVVRLSGTAWPNEDPKVLHVYDRYRILHSFITKTRRKWRSCVCFLRIDNRLCGRRVQELLCAVTCLFYMSLLQVVEVGLQLKALKLLGEASRKADEEVQSFSQECVESSSIIETYMALANFCDKVLRVEEQKETGGEPFVIDL